MRCITTNLDVMMDAKMIMGVGLDGELWTTSNMGDVLIIGNIGLI